MLDDTQMTVNFSGMLWSRSGCILVSASFLILVSCILWSCDIRWYSGNIMPFSSSDAGHVVTVIDAKTKRVISGAKVWFLYYHDRNHLSLNAVTDAEGKARLSPANINDSGEVVTYIVLAPGYFSYARSPERFRKTTTIGLVSASVSVTTDLPPSPVPSLETSVYEPQGKMTFRSSDVALIDVSEPKSKIGKGSPRIENVKAGEWKFYDRRFEGGENYELLAVHVEVADSLSQIQALTWEVNPISAGGDTACLCLCNVDAFGEDSLIPSTYKPDSGSTLSKWQQYVLARMNPADPEAIPHGVTFKCDVRMVAIVGRDKEGKVRAILLKMV
ncbi:MAG: hypothetical protein ACAI35_27085 [Candidatus Methylacidiphilales bacterium]